MILKSQVQLILMSALTLASIARLFLLVRFQPPWQFYHLDIALSVASCICFLVLPSLRWGGVSSNWCQVLLWMTPTFLTAQGVCLNRPPSGEMLTLQFLRVHFQQRENPFTPRVLLRGFPFSAVFSSLTKIIGSIVGAFYSTSAQPVCLFALALDYLMVMGWYLWLLGQATQARSRLRIISLCVSILFAILLAVAVLGSLWRSWDIALEVG